jgi:hypothetical protein
VTLSIMSEGLIVVSKCSNGTFIMSCLLMRMMLTTLLVNELLISKVD